MEFGARLVGMRLDGLHVPSLHTGAQRAAGVPQIGLSPSLWGWLAQLPPLPAGGCGGVAPVVLVAHRPIKICYCNCCQTRQI